MLKIKHANPQRTGNVKAKIASHQHGTESFWSFTQNCSMKWEHEGLDLYLWKTDKREMKHWDKSTRGTEKQKSQTAGLVDGSDDGGFPSLIWACVVDSLWGGSAALLQRVTTLTSYTPWRWLYSAMENGNWRTRRKKICFTSLCTPSISSLTAAQHKSQFSCAAVWSLVKHKCIKCLLLVRR